MRPARRCAGPRGEPRAAHDLAKSAPRRWAPGSPRRSKSFPPRRDAGDGNNQRTRAPGPGPDRGGGEDQGRAPGAAPFPAPRAGGLGPGGDTKKPGRPTPPAGARSDPGAPRPLTSLRRPPRTPLSPPGRSFPRPGSDPGIRPVPVPRRPRPRLGDLPSLALAPSPPSGGSSLPTAARSLPGATGRGGPAAALTRCCPARARAGASPGWRPAGLAPSIAPGARSPPDSFGPAVGSGHRGARSALSARKLQTTPRVFPARPGPPSPALAARRPVWSPPASAGGGAARLPPARPAAARGWQLFFPCFGASEMVLVGS